MTPIVHGVSLRRCCFNDEFALLVRKQAPLVPSLRRNMAVYRVEIELDVAIDRLGIGIAGGEGERHWHITSTDGRLLASATLAGATEQSALIDALAHAIRLAAPERSPVIGYAPGHAAD